MTTKSEKKLLENIFGPLSPFAKKQAKESRVPVMADLHPNNYSHFRIRPLVFTWGWCDICKCAFVRCPACGSNTCSPTYGTLPNGKFCACCELAFQYSEAADNPTEKEVKRAKGFLIRHSDLKLAKKERKTE